MTAPKQIPPSSPPVTSMFVLVREGESRKVATGLVRYLSLVYNDRRLSFVQCICPCRGKRSVGTTDTALLLSVLYLRVLKWGGKVALTRIGAVSNESRNQLLSTM